MNAKLIFTFAFLMLFNFVQAQEFPYQLVVLNEDYVALDDPIYLTDSPWDDPLYTIDFGFDFVFDSTTYSGLSATDYTGAMFDFTPYQDNTLDLLAVYISDIIDIGYGGEESLSHIAYQLTGEPGSHVLKIEWSNVGFYNEMEYNGTFNNTLSFQAWLYEGSNNIEVRYGPTFVKNPDVHDLGGPTTGFFFNFDTYGETVETYYGMVGDPAAPQIETLTDFPNTYPEGMDGEPVEGTVYRFTQQIVNTQDVSKIKSDIKVFPTLVENELTIQIDFENNENLHLSILDMLGKNCWSADDLRGHQTLSLSALPAGTYFVNIRSDKGVWVQKVVKQ